MCARQVASAHSYSQQKTQDHSVRRFVDYARCYCRSSVNSPLQLQLGTTNINSAIKLSHTLAICHQVRSRTSSKVFSSSTNLSVMVTAWPPSYQHNFVECCLLLSARRLMPLKTLCTASTKLPSSVCQKHGSVARFLSCASPSSEDTPASI